MLGRGSWNLDEGWGKSASARTFQRLNACIGMSRLIGEITFLHGLMRTAPLRGPAAAMASIQIYGHIVLQDYIGSQKEVG